MVGGKGGVGKVGPLLLSCPLLIRYSAGPSEVYFCSWSLKKADVETSGALNGQI